MRRRGRRRSACRHRWNWDRPGWRICAAWPPTIRCARFRRCRAWRPATTSRPSSRCAAPRSGTSAIVIDGSPTQLLMHAIRGANDSGSIAMINTDVLSRAALFGGPHPRPHGDWLGATLEFDVARRQRAIGPGLRAADQRHERVGRLRRAARPPAIAGRGWCRCARATWTGWSARSTRTSDSTIGFSDAQVEARLRPHAATAASVLRRRSAMRRIATRTPASPTACTRRGRAACWDRSRWRYATPRAVSDAASHRSSATIFEHRGVVGQHLADGRHRLVFWRGDV